MELRHLRYLCAVAGAQSFTAAARVLNVSQSGVSGQVRDLEREIGMKLLKRNQRAVSLTPEGAAFLPEAQQILEHAERAVEVARRASRGESGKLSVGLCGPVTAAFMPKLIREFRQRYPAVVLSLSEFAPFEHSRALIEGRIDVGFTRTVPVDMRHLIDHELLFREPIVAAIPREHVLAKEERIAIRQLAGEALVLYNRQTGPDVFDQILGLFAKARFTPKIAASSESWQTLLTLVEAGEGIGLIPACVQRLRSKDVVFRPMQGRSCQLDAILVWRRNEASALQRAMLAMIRERLAEWGLRER